jgi:hypothetical protein
MQSLHRVREGWVGRRTAVINQLRGLLLKRGITVRRGALHRSCITRDPGRCRLHFSLAIKRRTIHSGSATIHSELVMLMVFPFTSTCFLSEPQMDLIGEDIQFHLRMRSH